MSDLSQGPNWWLASDGKWYPPEMAATPPLAPPPPRSSDALVAGSSPTLTPWTSPPPVKHSQPAPPPPAKKPVTRRPWFWIGLSIFVLGSCTAIIIGAGVAVNNAVKKQHTIVYRVTGSTQTSDVTFSTFQEGTGHNGTAQDTGVSLPWTKTITVSGLFTSFNLTATVDADGGSVTCMITEDGRQLDNNTANGSFAAADCIATGS